MKKRWEKCYRKELLLPMLQRAFVRLVWGLFIAFGGSFLVERYGGRSVRSTLLALVGLCFLLGAWLCHLQLDGANLPRLQKLRARIDRKPKRTYGDMIDYVDQEPESWWDFDDEERTFCLLLADLLCAVLLLAGSLFL